MKATNFAQLGLRCHFLLKSVGWGNGLLAVLILLAACIWGWGIPNLDREIEYRQDLLGKAKLTLGNSNKIATVKVSESKSHLNHFYETLGESKYSEQQIKTISAIAEKNNLTLNQVEFKFSTNSNGQYQTYSISLPVKGAYPQIRHFCEDVLLSIQFASLDEIEFKRDSVSSTTLDAKLRFTLHLSNDRREAGQSRHSFGAEL